VKINFLTTYRNLESCPESDRPELIQEIGAKYFKVPGEGLELENTQVNTYIIGKSVTTFFASGFFHKSSSPSL
jgi:hypothetical protein